jgi:hypothetical protein
VENFNGGNVGCFSQSRRIDKKIAETIYVSRKRTREEIFT